MLATLLAYVATADNPVVGGGLLFTYCLGYVGPLLTVAAFTGALSRCTPPSPLHTYQIKHKKCLNQADQVYACDF